MFKSDENDPYNGILKHACQLKLRDNNNYKKYILIH